MTWLALLSGVAVSVRADESTRPTANAAKSAVGEFEFFEKSIRPLLVDHCYECHSAGEVNGGLALDTRDALLKGGDSGPAIVAGDPNKSLLIEAVRYKNPDLQMPPKNRLTPAEIEALEKWVSLGAPDPRRAADVNNENAKADLGTAPTGMSIEAGREFWSFKPVANPAVPVVSKADWVRTPIDAFILAKLETEGLQPAPPADLQTLIRRVTFDLTGLPPTPQEIEEFVRACSPNTNNSKSDASAGDAIDPLHAQDEAYAALIERLLASPDYGVRWGRHWLDVARYADSNGLDENLAFGNAWRYRDYVVDAFQRDKPFDQFLIEQLAGDLVPWANRETKTATGFLSLGAKVLAEPDREKLVMDTIDEQIDTTGKAFLGMTLGCVRCHDHKFDPIKQSDYYALAGIFKSTKTFDLAKSKTIKAWHEHSFASPEELEQLKKVDAEIAEKKKAATTFKNDAIAKIRTQAREKAADYLAAAAGFDPSMPLTQVERLAKPLGLHPRILHYCRLHLTYHSDDEVFAKWHELAAAGDIEGIERHYRPLFEAAESAWSAALKANPKAKKLDDAQLEPVRAALYDTAGFLAVPPQPEFAFDASTLEKYYELAKAARVLESGAPDESSAMGVSDDAVLTTVPIHIRGSHRNLGRPVERGFPEVMQTSTVRPILRTNQSGRLELAQWLTSTQHPLTARVYVNRIWRWHFGAGIVASTENFGRIGDRPTHPELLDWLARNFIENGSSTKHLHRLILKSSAYRMASRHADESQAAAIDPENKLLWKFRVQRLEAEQIRDSVLAVSNRLDTSIGGKAVPLRNRQFVFDHTSIDHTKYDSLRRSLYLPVIRNNLYSLFEQFDFPDPTMPTGNRNATVVAPQALLVMNAELIMDSADEMARLLLELKTDDPGRIAAAYERAFGRSPTTAESRRALAFVDEVTSDGRSWQSAEQMYSQRRRAWSLMCQSLFASNEFVYVR
jgi:mono/diheme cytochrome c family protein